MLAPINNDMNKVTIAVSIICPTSLAIVRKAEAYLIYLYLQLLGLSLLLGVENPPKPIPIKTNVAADTHKESL